MGSKYLAISMPPQHGKSTLISTWTPEWFLANHPEQLVGLASYGADLAQSFSRKVRDRMRRHSAETGVPLAMDSQASDVWNTDVGGLKSGGMWSAGVGGAITGKRANFLIIDDPVKNAEEANSLTYRDALWDWWLTTALTRTHVNTVIVVVMTRWHTDDFVGRLTSHEYPGNPEDWRVIEFPAIWDQNKPDALGRKKGEPLCPFLHPIEFLEEKRVNSGEEVWLSLYQQKPRNTTGIGQVYYNFDEGIHVKPLARNDRLPVIWSLDFNVNPMASVIAQMSEAFAPGAYMTNEKFRSFEVLDEIVLPDSNTPQMCDEFANRLDTLLHGMRAEVHVYGDATANRRDTRGAQSDWELVRKFLTNARIPFKWFVTESDPLQKNRVAAMNNALKDIDGRVSLYVNQRCKELRMDLKEVRWKKDSAGNSTSQLDKSDPKRTHVSDALGYAVYGKFALATGGGERSGMAR